MAGASTIKPCWTRVRTQGADRVVLPYTRPPAEGPGIAGRQTASFLDHDCPGCGGALKDDEELVTLVVGPGVDDEARTAQRRGEWFDAVAVICHKLCVGGSRAATRSPAMKVAVAAAMIREAALETSARVKAHGVPSEYDPTQPLFNIAGHAEGVSKDLSGWEEQLV